MPFAFSQIEAVFGASRWKEIRGAGLVLHGKNNRESFPCVSSVANIWKLVSGCYSLTFFINDW